MSTTPNLNNNKKKILKNGLVFGTFLDLARKDPDNSPKTPLFDTQQAFTQEKGPKDKKPCTDQKNPKNRKKCKTFPRSKNAQNSRQNTFAQQFGHRDLKWTAGCVTKEKCAKRAFLHPKTGPFWTPQIGPSTRPDTQNKFFFKSCTDSSQLDLQRGHRVKK
jgi:hypothetical protein